MLDDLLPDLTSGPFARHDHVIPVLTNPFVQPLRFISSSRHYALPIASLSPRRSMIASAVSRKGFRSAFWRAPPRFLVAVTADGISARP